VIPANDTTLTYPSWTLQFVDSQELVGGDGRGVNGFDGDTGTLWHTQWVKAAPPPPHEIQIQLGGPAILNGFVYVPWQDGSPNGMIKDYEFYVSTDGVNWGSPVATGTWVGDATQKQVSFASTTGQYVRLRALSEVNGNPFISNGRAACPGLLYRPRGETGDAPEPGAPDLYDAECPSQRLFRQRHTK
jgi:hypothetical protein